MLILIKEGVIRSRTIFPAIQNTKYIIGLNIIIIIFKIFVINMCFIFLKTYNKI